VPLLAGGGEERSDRLALVRCRLVDSFRSSAPEELRLCLPQALARCEEGADVHALVPGELVHDTGGGGGLAQVLDSHGGGLLAVAAEALGEVLPGGCELIGREPVEMVDLLLEVDGQAGTVTRYAGSSPQMRTSCRREK
jgi:hypothetical protein